MFDAIVCETTIQVGIDFWRNAAYVTAYVGFSIFRKFEKAIYFLIL